MCCEHVLIAGRPIDAGDTEDVRHITLEPVPSSVSSARRFVAGALDGQVDPPQLDSAVLLVSELVTNGVLHARTPIELGVVCGAGWALVAVADRAETVPVPQPHSTSRVGGRGLALVDAMADDWGAVQVADGKVMWFAVAGAGARRTE